MRSLPVKTASSYNPSTKVNTVTAGDILGHLPQSLLASIREFLRRCIQLVCAPSQRF